MFGQMSAMGVVVGNIAVIDAPRAGTGGGLGTVAASINWAGMITGYSVDSNNVAHGVVGDGPCSEEHCVWNGSQMIAVNDYTRTGPVLIENW